MDPIAPPAAAGAAPAESLVTSLCWEMDRLRRRAGQVVAGLERCQDPQLFERLRQELRQLGGRREELQRVAGLLRRRLRVQDGLTLAFLEELTRRPLVCGWD
jgi:hypothetical protein